MADGGVALPDDFAVPDDAEVGDVACGDATTARTGRVPSGSVCFSSASSSCGSSAWMAGLIFAQPRHCFMMFSRWRQK